MKLVSPISYQGGKQRIAGAILDIIRPSSDGYFYDLCCGSGAISIELVNRGFPASKIVMLDRGPWGMFWNAVGMGEFCVERFKEHCSRIPSDPGLIKSYLEGLASQPVGEDAIYVYLLLQAGSFGGKALWINDGRWRNTSFRNFWQPTATSNRRSHVNPMMPMPQTLLERVKIVVAMMKDIRGFSGDICEFQPENNGIVYIDPPYSGTTHYGYSFDVVSYVRGLKNKCYVSEGRQLSDVTHIITGGRKKGGISGERAVAPNEEWLSEFN